MTRVLEIVLDIGHSPAAASPPDAADLPRALAAALPHLDVLTPEAGMRIDTVTFDHDHALTAAGWRVAVETQGTAREVTVSNRIAFSPGVTAYTPIFVAPLSAAGVANALFDAAPVPFREALAAAGELSACATLTSDRHRWQGTRDGVALTLSLDAALCEPLAGAAAPLQELRIAAPWPEESDATAIVETLFACARDVVDALPALVRLDDVLARMASDAPPQPQQATRAVPVDLRGAGSAEAALLAIAGNITAHWFGNDVGVRDIGSGEFVHQLRVAHRRLATAMRIFSPWRDDNWLEHIAPDLQWLRALLGEARDRDVFTDATLPMLVQAEGDLDAWAPLCARADAERLVARSRVQDALASRRYARVALAWLQWLATLTLHQAAATDAGPSLREHAKKRVRRYHRQLMSAEKLTTLDDAARHRVRIDAKYLRYTLEFFAQITSRATRSDAVKTLTRIQAALGDGNDAAVALAFLEQMDVDATRRGFARGWCEALKRATAKEGERLVRELRKPKVVGGV